MKKQRFEIQNYDECSDKEILIYENRRNQYSKGICISIDIDDCSESEFKHIMRGIKKIETILNKHWEDKE